MGSLNSKQSEACRYTDGPLLILAGAGSGKTRVITHRIAYLIDELSVNPYNILAITFTNKAAKEMRERVDRIVAYGAESVWVSTFHSMCVRILRQHIECLGGKSNFTIYDTDEQKTVMKEVLKYLNLDTKMYPERAMLAAISKAKEEYVSPDQYEKRAATSYREQQIANIYREYQKRLQSNNALDFDDLIYKTIELFEHNPDVLEIYQNRFKYIMVDEYQDTNHTQFLLVKQLAAKYQNLCVVGDDDQSIYKFRGADIHNILDFEEEYPNAKVIRLEQNYRSTANILNAANGVIANNEGRKDKTLWTENEDGGKVTYTEYENEYQEAESVVNDMIEKSGQGNSLNDMAVLYRTNNQSRVLEEKLLMNNVPYTLVGGTNFYSRKEIRDMVSYLKVVANANDDLAVARIINVPKRGIGDTTINRAREFALLSEMNLYDVLLTPEEIPGIQRAAEKIHGFTRQIEGFRQFMADATLDELYEEILEKTGYKMQLEAEGTDEARSRIDNLKELKNKIVKYEEEAEEPSLMELLEEISLVADTDREEDTEKERVTLMTLHSAKGLEFPYVYIVGMEERLFPSGMAIDSDDMDAVEEERRLCYVGFTRAMKGLALSGAGTRMVNGTRIYSKTSRFIDEIPENLLIRRGISEPVSYEKRNWRNPEPQTSFSKSTSFPKKEKPYAGLTMSSPLISKGMPGQVVIDFAVGDTVKHLKFGKGTVTELVKTGTDYEVKVNFERVGEKKMFASLAKLKKL